MNKAYSIDPTDKIVVFGGIVITGYASGKHITVKLDEDDFTDVDGNHGDSTRVRNRKNSGEVVLVLQESALTNTLLSAHRAIDLTTGRNVVPFVMKDKNGATLVTAKYAWIKKAPDVGVSDTVENREWTIKLKGVRETYFVGGNSSL